MPSVIAASTGLAIVSLASIVGGYVVCAVLWYVMVKRPGSNRSEAEFERRPRK
jgi:hypothetical protein